MWVCVPPAHIPVLTPPPDPGTGDLYTMDDSQLVSDKSPLEEPPDLPSLRCAASPPLHAAGPFSLLPAGPPPAPLLAGPGSPPALHGTCHTRTGWCPPAGRSSPPHQLAPPAAGGWPPRWPCSASAAAAAPLCPGRAGTPRTPVLGSRSRCWWAPHGDERCAGAGACPRLGVSSTPWVPPASSGRGCTATRAPGTGGGCRVSWVEQEGGRARR